jgi:uncharacterized protein (TIGR02271 family)
MSTEQEAVVVRHEEELEVGKTSEVAGTVRARKVVEARQVEEVIPRDVEQADVERVPAKAGDSGEIETLPDGSVSIPVLEEELVVTKRTVVRERILIRKHTVTEHERVKADLRKERVEIEESPGLEIERGD